MRTKRKNASVWAHLERLNILATGTEAEIQAAKRAYWRAYRARLRKAERQERPEFTIAFSRKSGDYGKVALAAKRHKQPMTTFIRNATLAYLDRRFLILSPDRVAHIEQLLMACLNEVQKLVAQKEKYHFEREQKFDAIAKRITQLETEIRQVLVFPQEQAIDDRQDTPV